MYILLKVTSETMTLSLSVWQEMEFKAYYFMLSVANGKTLVFQDTNSW